MSHQDFEVIQKSGLLRQVEDVVVDAHRRWHQERGLPWSMPDAYRWLKFESDIPVARLLKGARQLMSEGGAFDRDAVEKACSEARQLGFSN